MEKATRILVLIGYLICKYDNYSNVAYNVKTRNEVSLTNLYKILLYQCHLFAIFQAINKKFSKTQMFQQIKICYSNRYGKSPSYLSHSFCHFMKQL